MEQHHRQLMGLRIRAGQVGGNLRVPARCPAPEKGSGPREEPVGVLIMARRGTLSGQSCEAGRRVLDGENRRKGGPWEWTSTVASAVGVAVGASKRREAGAHAAPASFTFARRKRGRPKRTTHPSADFLRGQQQGGLAANKQFGDASVSATPGDNDYGFGQPKRMMGVR